MERIIATASQSVGSAKEDGAIVSDSDRVIPDKKLKPEKYLDGLENDLATKLALQECIVFLKGIEELENPKTVKAVKKQVAPPSKGGPKFDNFSVVLISSLVREAGECRTTAQDLLNRLNDPNEYDLNESIRLTLDFRGRIQRLFDFYTGRTRHWTSSLKKARAAGSNKSLSTEQEAIALKVIKNHYHPPEVDLAPACRRAAAELMKEYEIEVSDKTLQRIYKRIEKG